VRSEGRAVSPGERRHPAAGTDPGRVQLTVPLAPEGETLLGTWTLDGRGDDVISPARAIQSRLAGEAIIDDGPLGDRTMHLVLHWPFPWLVTILANVLVSADQLPFFLVFMLITGLAASMICHRKAIKGTRAELRRIVLILGPTRLSIQGQLLARSKANSPI